MKRATTTSKEAQRLGLLFFKSRSNGTYYLCRELKNYDYNDNFDNNCNEQGLVVRKDEK